MNNYQDQNAIVPGSLSSIAARDGASLVEVFMSCDYIILVDTSGSMSEQDSRGGKSRYDVACDELRKLQSSLPGKLGIFSYSSECMICPGGVPNYQGGGTELLEAMEYVEPADGTIKKYVVISDGYPESGTENSILALARRMITPIDTIFAGPIEDMLGRQFMAELANAGRGRSEFSANASDLGDSARKLLT